MEVGRQWGRLGTYRGVSLSHFYSTEIPVFDSLLEKISAFKYGEPVTPLWLILYLRYISRPTRSFDDFVIESGGHNPDKIRDKLFNVRDSIFFKGDYRKNRMPLEKIWIKPSLYLLNRGGTDFIFSLRVVFLLIFTVTQGDPMWMIQKSKIKDTSR